MRVRLMFLVLSLFLFGLAFVFFPQPRAAQQTSKNKVSTSTTSGLGGFIETEVVNKTFLTELTKDGAISRQLDSEAATAFRVDKERAPLHAITDTPKQNVKQQAEPRPLILKLQGTTQLEGFPQAKAAFLRAAAKWEAILLGKPEPQIPAFQLPMDIDFGPTAFGFPFNQPTVLGVTNVPVRKLIATSSRSDQFQSWSSTSPQVSVYSFLPYPWKTDLGDTEHIDFPTSISKMIGFVEEIPTPLPSIAFNSAVKFDFDPSDGIDADKIDFEAIALRELGRCLGFISNVGQRELDLTLRGGPFGARAGATTFLDLHRYRPGVDMDLLATAPKVQTSGGEQIFFTSEVDAPMSTGRPDGTGGDERPAGHWKDDVLTGQYLGIMDPTLAPGERGGISANDLLAMGYMFYRINPETRVMEVLSVDDNSRDDTLPFNGAMVVNRVTPTRSSFKLEAVRVHLPAPTGGGSPTGQQLRIVAFVDPDRTGLPGSPTFLVDRTITIPNVPENRWLEVMVPDGPTINSGDLYIGVQSSGNNVLFAGDDDAPKSGSFISTNNGASFQPLRAADQAPLNFMARAVVTAEFDSETNLIAELSALSPSVTAAGGGDFTLYVQGKNFLPPSVDSDGFQQGSVVLWNGVPHETFFLSKSRLRTTIRKSEIAQIGNIPITVVTIGRNGDRVTLPLEFRVGSATTRPIIDRLDPPLGAAGSGPLTLSIFGRDFRADSIVRWSGKDRTTTLVNSTQLKTTIPASDLTGILSADITIFTPGGGESNPVSFRTVSCTYSLAHTLLNVRPGFGNSKTVGTRLITQAHCPWTVQSNVPWIDSIYTPINGVGNVPVLFKVNNNSSPTQRIGSVTIAGQMLTISQPGTLASVSAASYNPLSTANAIVTSFGVGLAKTTQTATVTPLPLTLDGTSVVVTDVDGYEYPAPLFFVSPTQINFVMPADVLLPPATTTTIGSSVVSVYVDGALVAENNLRLAAVAPSLFTANSSGQGTAIGVVLRVRENGTQEYEPIVVFDPVQNKLIARPIDLGLENERVFLVLFGTGIRNRSVVRGTNIKIDNLDAPISFAGAQGDLIGVDQVNVELPKALRGRGEVGVSLAVDGFNANTVTVTIK